MRMMLIADYERCTGCRACEAACSFKHFGEFNPRRSRITVVRDPLRGVNFPVFCLQCEDAPCVESCPTGALQKRDGLVELNHDLCIGCKTCVAVCPFGGVVVDPATSKPIKCDLCGGDPECVKFCTPGVLKYVPVTVANVEARKRAVKNIPRLLELVLPRPV
ncbi:MAG: 4Fe-4S dicluster domain-containing protein [Thermoproteota archaeon]|nr:MAG: 4Fe-4S dicluster domain-containing protein [Candidatus Korarchaeota archaeon]